MNFRKILSITFVICMCFSSISCAFSDLPSNHWAHNAVTEMTNDGVLNGYPDGTFRPENMVSRAEFATMLVNILNIEENGKSIKFKDVEGVHWSERSVNLAGQFLTGYKYNGEYYFKPDEFALREDAAVALVKAMGLKSEDVNILDRFNDKEEISENLAKYVASAIENGLMRGYPDGTFKPKQGLTRAEVASLFYKIYNDRKAPVEDEKIVIDDIKNEPTKPQNNKKDSNIGDINRDGVVDADDVNMISLYLRGKGTLSESQKELADVFVDGKIDEMDKFALQNYMYGDLNEIPHTCGSYKIINKEPSLKEYHEISFRCSCGEMVPGLAGPHYFKNGKCVCGAREESEPVEIPFKVKNISDNSNGLVFAAVLEMFYEDENNTYFFGQPISEYIIVKYTNGSTENVKDALKNGRIQITDLDKYGINYFTESKVKNVITWDGEYISNINGLIKVKLTKLSDTEVKFEIKGITHDEKSLNEGMFDVGFGCNNKAVIVGNEAKAKYEIFDNKGELTFKFAGKELIIETSGYEDLSVFAGRYQVNDGSVAEIKWTIPRNPIEGEYLFGKEIENVDLGNIEGVETLEDLQKYFQTMPDSITLEVFTVNDNSANFAMGGFKNGNMILMMGELEKNGDKWRYFNEDEQDYIIEILFEEDKAVVTQLIYDENVSLSGTYIKRSPKHEYEKYEEMLAETSFGEGVWFF